MPGLRGMPQKTRREFGNLGEDYAAKLLKSKGYQVISRNFRTKFGEIDIVAIHEGTLVFVEVKTRWSKRFGNPEEAVTPAKLRRIKKAAEYFSLTHNLLPKKLAIEVVAIEVEEGRVTSARIIQTY